MKRWCFGALWPLYPLEASADGALNVREDGCERVPVIGVAGERLHVGDKLATPAAVEGRRHADLDAELLGFVGLAFANALDLRRKRSRREAAGQDRSQRAWAPQPLR